MQLIHRLSDANFPFRPKEIPFNYGWAIVLVSIFGFIFSTPGQTIGFGVFAESILKVSELNRFQLSCTYFCGTMLASLCLRNVGRFYDNFGGRLLLVAGACCLSITLLVFSSLGSVFSCLQTTLNSQAKLISTIVVLCICFFLLRVSGQGALALASRNLLGKWFEKNRGFYSALSGLAITGGFSLIPPLYLILIRAFGWEKAYSILALAVFISFSFLWVFYRDNPEECGLSAGGIEGIKARFTGVNLKKAKQTIEFWTLCLVSALNSLLFTGLTFHIEDIGAESGLSVELAIQIFIPIAVFSSVANFVSGFLADRINFKFVLILLTFAGALGAWGCGHLATGWGYLLTYVGFGVMNGCSSIVASVGIPYYFGRKYLGEKTGFFMSIVIFSSSIGPIFFAGFKHQFGTYHTFFLVFMTASALLMLLSFTMKQSKYV